LRHFVESLGLEPLLSERAEFPVTSDLNTLDNCLKTVQEKADIFVLIIGGRYGTRNDEGRSITNLEYVRARAKGIPIFIFISRTVLEALPIWKANPSSDFSAVVESSQVFNFVSEVRDTNRSWTYAFDTVQEIVAVLKNQIAYLMSDSLALRLRANSSRALTGRLNQLQGEELRLVLERPRLWAYRLFFKSLKRELNELEDLKSDADYGLAYGSTRRLSPIEFIRFNLDKGLEAQRLVEGLQTLADKALIKALGPPGVPADPEGILYVASRIGLMCRSVLLWKIEFYQLSVDPELSHLKAISASFFDHAVKNIDDWTTQSDNTLIQLLGAPDPEAPIYVELKLGFDKLDLTEFTEEIQRVSRLIAEGKLGDVGD